MGHTYWLRAARVDIKQSNVRITSCSQVAFVWGYLKPIDMLRITHGESDPSQKFRIIRKSNKRLKADK